MTPDKSRFIFRRTISVLEILGTANTTCKVQNIVSVFGEPVAFVCSLHNENLKDNELLLERLHQECISSKTMGSISFDQGEMIAVLPEGSSSHWSRGILDVKVDEDETWHVVGCDTGTSMNVTAFDMKPMSGEMKNIPRFSVYANVVDMTVTPVQLWENHLKNGSELQVSNIMHLQGKEKTHTLGSIIDDKGHLICIIELSDWLPLRPRYIPLCEPMILPNKCEVTIQSYCTSNLVYVSLFKDLDVLQEFHAIHDFLSYHCDALCPAMTELPEVGQMVGARSNIDGQYYRAVVTRMISKDSVLVFFVDHGNKEEIVLGNLYLLPEDLAKVQCHAVLVSLENVPDKPLNMPSLDYLNKLVKEKTELMLQYDNNGEHVTLIELGSAVSVCTQLRTCLEGSWIKSIDVYSDIHTEDLIHNYKKGYETLDSLMETHLPVGQQMRLVCLQWLGNHVIACCRAYHPLLRYVAVTLTDLISKYIEQCDAKMYVPCHLELCLAQFSKDDKWYRALATSISLTDCEISYVDYCNVEILPFSRVRKMPADFAEAPILATVTSLAGLKDSDFPNPILSKRIVQLLGSNMTFEGIVISKQTENSNSVLYIPRLLTTLIKEQLIPEYRLDQIKTKLKTVNQSEGDALPKYLDTLQILQPKKFDDMMKHHLKAPKSDLIDLDFEVSPFVNGLPINNDTMATMDLLSSPITAETFDFSLENLKSQQKNETPVKKTKEKSTSDGTKSKRSKEKSEKRKSKDLQEDRSNVLAQALGIKNQTQTENQLKSEKSECSTPCKLNENEIKKESWSTILSQEIVLENPVQSKIQENPEPKMLSSDAIKKSTKTEKVQNKPESWSQILSGLSLEMQPSGSQIKPPEVIKKKKEVKKSENRGEEIDEEKKILVEMVALQAKLATIQLKKMENTVQLNGEKEKKSGSQDEKKKKRYETPEERKERKRRERHEKKKETTSDGESVEEKNMRKKETSEVKKTETTEGESSGQAEERKKKRKEKDADKKKKVFKVNGQVDLLSG